jgi:hypothetical protein
LEFDRAALEAALEETPRASLSAVRYGLESAKDVIEEALRRVRYSSRPTC